MPSIPWRCGVALWCLNAFVAGAQPATESAVAPPASSPALPGVITVTNATVPGVNNAAASEEPIDEEQVSIPAEATAKTNPDGATGGQAGVGFSYRARNGYLRARINIAAATFEIVNGAPQDYAAFLLQPDLRGASVALDGALLWRPGRWQFGIGGGLRVSPTMSWVLDTTTAEMPGTRSKRDVIAAALAVALVAKFDLPAGENGFGNASFSLEVPLTARWLMGDVTQDPDFLLATLGNKSVAYVGAEPRLKISVGDLGVFAAFPILANVGAGRVPGLTGVNVIIGAEVRGDVVSWTIFSAASEQKVKAAKAARTVLPTRPATDVSLSL